MKMLNYTKKNSKILSNLVKFTRKVLKKKPIFDNFSAKSSFRSTLMPRWRPKIFNFPPKNALLWPKSVLKFKIFRPNPPSPIENHHEVAWFSAIFQNFGPPRWKFRKKHPRGENFWKKHPPEVIISKKNGPPGWKYPKKTPPGGQNLN